MSVPTALAYWIVGGVLLASLLAPALLGAEGWAAPLAVALIAVPYLIFDRRLARAEERQGGG
jgi:hypothetical protein